MFFSVHLCVIRRRAICGKSTIPRNTQEKMEESAAAAAAPPPKRRRGRPPTLTTSVFLHAYSFRARHSPFICRC
jgi:hypothetical protein